MEVVGMDVATIAAAAVWKDADSGRPVPSTECSGAVPADVAAVTGKDEPATAAFAASANPTAAERVKAIHKAAANSTPLVHSAARAHMQVGDAAAVGVTDVSAAAVAAVGAMLISADESGYANKALAANGKLQIVPPAPADNLAAVK